MQNSGIKHVAQAVIIVASFQSISHADDVKVISITSAPFGIKQSGHYRLDADITYSRASGAAIEVNASDVVLDLNTHSIHGTAGSETTAFGIKAVDRSDVTIRNGRVTGFYYGIDLVATDPKKSSKHRLHALTVDRCWYFGMRVVGTDCEINKCKILDTGGSTKKAHTVPIGVRLVGPNNALRNSQICDLRLKRFPDGKGEIVAVHFDDAENSMLGKNLIVEQHKSTDAQFDKTDERERRFGVWINGGPRKDTFLTVRNNQFYGFTVPLAFTPGTDGTVRKNVFYDADPKPIRGRPAKQLSDNTVKSAKKPIRCQQAPPAD